MRASVPEPWKIELAVFTGLWLTWIGILDAGTANGVGYFHQPLHDLTAPLVVGGLFNAATFAAHGWWLLPRRLAQRQWRRYVLELTALFLLVVTSKTLVERMMIVVWMPDLTGVPFHLLALENVYSFAAFVVLSAAYRFGRDWLARGAREPSTDTDSIPPGPARGSASETAEAIYLRSGGADYRVRLEDLLWVEGADKYLAFVLPEKRLLTVMTMREALALLPEGEFVRIHRSFIVALRHVDSATRLAVKIHGKSLPISRSYRAAFSRRFERFTTPADRSLRRARPGSSPPRADPA